MRKISTLMLEQRALSKGYLEDSVQFSYRHIDLMPMKCLCHTNSKGVRALTVELFCTTQHAFKCKQ